MNKQTGPGAATRTAKDPIFRVKMDHIWSLKCARNDHHISEDQEAATKCSKRMVKRRERIAMMRRLRRRERNFGPQQQNLPKKGQKT